DLVYGIFTWWLVKLRTPRVFRIALDNETISRHVFDKTEGSRPYLMELIGVVGVLRQRGRTGNPQIDLTQRIQQWAVGFREQDSDGIIVHDFVTSVGSQQKKRFLRPCCRVSDSIQIRSDGLRIKRRPIVETHILTQRERI